MDLYTMSAILLGLLGSLTASTLLAHRRWVRRRQQIIHVDIEGYRLEAPAWWPSIPDDIRTGLVNGIGPDRWPQAYRDLVALLTGMRPVSVIHDVEYAVYRTRDERLTADRRFLLNCLRLIWQKAGGPVGLLRHPWRTARQLLTARALYRILRIFGRQAFDEASKVDLSLRGKDASPILPNDEIEPDATQER